MDPANSYSFYVVQTEVRRCGVFSPNFALTNLKVPPNTAHPNLRETLSYFLAKTQSSYSMMQLIIKTFTLYLIVFPAAIGQQDMNCETTDGKKMTCTPKSSTSGSANVATSPSALPTSATSPPLPASATPPISGNVPASLPSMTAGAGIGSFPSTAQPASQPAAGAPGPNKATTPASVPSTAGVPASRVTNDPASSASGGFNSSSLGPPDVPVPSSGTTPPGSPSPVGSVAPTTSGNAEKGAPSDGAKTYNLECSAFWISGLAIVVGVTTVLTL
ncbi:hypothetical protein CROQUDRAFT_96188 [Cronartium quercuum f. sp. fusiforme G11]|uniref:Uncharacterized protein n=1 Tax=Cronartium quercuum f. sp. fusiforme G11 TaxID=708437 RepID=A0A9P6T9F2_9BASI|nr:hypothetical protein CROQUDRAFT_96188 [Cronartium quercuum f. sp. fusiforme G11]